MAWTKAARDAAIAARRAKAKGSVAQQAAKQIAANKPVRAGQGFGIMRDTPDQAAARETDRLGFRKPTGDPRLREEPMNWPKKLPPKTKSAGLDAYGRPKMKDFPTGIRHELGTNAPVRWTQPQPTKRKKKR